MALKLDFVLIVALALLFEVEVAAQRQGDRYVSGIAVAKPPRPDCPCFISKVIPESPAAAAGITAGDRLLTIADTDINGLSLQRILGLLSSDSPGSVALRLWRKGRTYDAVLVREQLAGILARRGMKIVAQGLIVPSDATETEIERLSQIMSSEGRLVAHPFPAHVPLNNEIFHGGFALLVLRDPDQVVATGVEDGPAFRAGVREGDIILAVNGVDLRGKTPVQIEALFSRDGPELVRLKIDRGGTLKTVEYQMERVSEILKANELRLIDGRVVPLGLADEDIPCYTARK